MRYAFSDGKDGRYLRHQESRRQSETKKFLESLGFVNGTFVSIISFNQGNVIVSIKDSRIAIDKSMAMKITV